MTSPPHPNWRSLWNLDPSVTYLNHGSFGACPRPVLDYQQELRDRLERQPLQFFSRDLDPLLDGARQCLATFVGADPTDLVFVPNATTGINAVLRSLCFPSGHRSQLQPGDELLTTNHEYNASRNVLEFAARQSGATVVIAEVPFPVECGDQIQAALLDRVTPRTKLVLLDHVTSQTGLIFPIAPIIEQLNQQGIDTLIDGAHAPGMIPLSIRALGATYYTGNCHKWLCSPKGAGFLYVQPDRQDLIRPVTISHGANSPRRDRSRYWLEFDWTGTGDPTAYLSVPKAIEVMGSLLPGGWAALMEYNHNQALLARSILCETWNLSPPCPGDLVAAMVSLPLPDRSGDHDTPMIPAELTPDQLYETLLKEFQIEVPIIPWMAPFPHLIRISSQIYNNSEQYQFLAQSLLKLLHKQTRPMA